MPAPSLRAAASHDLVTLLELVRQYYEFDQHPFDEASLRRALDELIADSSLGQVWLICDEHTPVGYIILTYGFSLEFRGRDAFVDEFYLKAGYRGRGWGRRTVEHVEDAARRRGVRAIHLEVTRQNERAQGLYRKLGFIDHDRHLMTKRIDEPAGG